MNKVGFKKIALTASLVLATALTLLIGACSGDGNGSEPPPNAQPLSTPANVRISEADFTLKWDAVPGASAYSVDIGGTGEIITIANTEYSLKRLASDSKVYKLRVKAVAESGDTLHSDSPYSNALDCEPAVYVFEFDDAPAAKRTGLAKGIRAAAATGGTITGLTIFGKTLETINIPATIGNVAVVKIGSSAFANNSIIISVIIPETVVEVGANAFKGSTALSTVVFNGEIEALGNGAFQGCNALENIIIPEGSADDYAKLITESTPEMSGTVSNIVQEKTEDTKILIAIEVTRLPTKTAYMEGEFFSPNGMSVTARYSDNTTATVTNYKLLLQNGNDFTEQSRALTASDETVRLSYTEGGSSAGSAKGITKTANIAITVTASQSSSSEAILSSSSEEKEILSSSSEAILSSSSVETTTYYTVTFNALNGTFKDNSRTMTMQVEAGKTISPNSVETPMFAGYTFGGWSMGSSGTFTGLCKYIRNRDTPQMFCISLANSRRLVNPIIGGIGVQTKRYKFLP